MVPGYYMSKRRLSLPKLDEKDLSVEIQTVEKAMTGRKKESFKMSPRPRILSSEQ
jgi:hypothetical protein